MYGIVWSDNNHEFGEPTPISKSDVRLYKFPDAIVRAKNKKQASKMVAEINYVYKNRIREDIPSKFIAFPPFLERKK